MNAHTTSLVPSAPRTADNSLFRNILPPTLSESIFCLGLGIPKVRNLMKTNILRSRYQKMKRYDVATAGRWFFSMCPKAGLCRIEGDGCAQ
jgi:hypothetical protein